MFEETSPTDAATGRRRGTILVLGRESPPKVAIVAALAGEQAGDWKVATAPDVTGDLTAVVVIAGGDDPLGGAAGDVPDPDRVIAALVDRRPRHLVLVESALAYGAHPTNPIPITDSGLVRPNEGLSGVHCQVELERRIRAFARDREVNLAVLRCAPVVGGRPGGASPFTDRVFVGLQGPMAPSQFLHEVDLATAVRHILDNRLGGTLNVAPDGWLTAEEVSRITGRPGPRLRLPFDAYVRWTLRRHRGRSRSAAVARASALRYSTVVANTALRRSGWKPARTNAMALRMVNESDRAARRDRARRRRRAAGPAVVLAVGAFGAAAMGYGRSRHRRVP